MSGVSPKKPFRKVGKLFLNKGKKTDYLTGKFMINGKEVQLFLFKDDPKESKAFATVYIKE